MSYFQSPRDKNSPQWSLNGAPTSRRVSLPSEAPLPLRSKPARSKATSPLGKDLGRLLLKNVTPIAISLLAVVTLFFSITGTHGLLHLRKINNEMALLVSKNQQLQTQIVERSAELYNLAVGGPGLEKFAREELKLSRPGETVYVFSQSAEKLP